MIGTPRQTDNLALWAGVLGGPVAWMLQLVGVYAMSMWACAKGALPALHLTALVCLLLALGGGWVAYRAWRSVGGWPSDADEGEAARVRFLSVLGLLTGSFFTVAILAGWVAVFLLDPCPA